MFSFQLTVDHKLLIRNLCTGWPGSVHDARVYRRSGLGAELQKPISDRIAGEHYVLGTGNRLIGPPSLGAGGVDAIWTAGRPPQTDRVQAASFRSLQVIGIINITIYTRSCLNIPVVQIRSTCLFKKKPQ